MRMSFNFKEIEKLYGHKNFSDFEKEYDDEIIYADGCKSSVEQALLEPADIDTDMTVSNIYSSIGLYLFDGWFVAVK